MRRGEATDSKRTTTVIRAAQMVVIATAIGWLSACSQEPAEKPIALPALGAKTSDVTVSGISSGAYMAGQFEFAHGAIVSGAAIIAGGPYGCSESMFASTMPITGTPMLNLNKAINGCMLGLLDAWGATDAKRLAEKTKERAERGDIDPLSNVTDDRVYLFTGQNDRTVVPSVVKAAAAFYKTIGVQPANIKLVSDLPAGHAFVTEDAGAACEISEQPYVVDCNYDQAGDVLRHFYGQLNPRSNAPSGRFITFDQTVFDAGSAPDGMEDSGVAYIPKSCDEAAGCRIHIAFHGCAQNRSSGGETFIRKTGFDRWADNNRLIILFPQVKITAFNPQGCWDWWGYTGAGYLTRNAPQIRAVKAMIDRLTTARTATMDRAQ